MKTNYEINDEMLLNGINGGAADNGKENNGKDARDGGNLGWHWGEDWGEGGYWR